MSRSEWSTTEPVELEPWPTEWRKSTEVEVYKTDTVLVDTLLILTIIAWAVVAPAVCVLAWKAALR